MQNDHAFLAPSSAHIWGVDGGCHAYPRMAAAFPENGEMPAAREGTAAHWYISDTLHGVVIQVGDIAPNGVAITQEMIDCSQDILSDVAKWRGGGEGRFVIEERLYMPIIHPTANWGTVDIGGVDMKARKARVWDFKFGHSYVDAFENPQCIDYMVGLFRHFAIPLESVGDWEIEVGIFQPRCYHPEGPRKIWTTSGVRFLELVDRLARNARKSSDPNAEMHTGTHCAYCEARYACPALMAAGGASVDLSYQGAPYDLTPEKAGLLRAHIEGAQERLKAIMTGLDAQILTFLRSGKRVPFADMKQGEGRENWTRPLEEVYALGDMLGHDLRKPGALTPKQARDLGVDSDLVGEISARNKGEFKIVTIQDNTAAKAFK